MKAATGPWRATKLDGPSHWPRFSTKSSGNPASATDLVAASGAGALGAPACGEMLATMKEMKTTDLKKVAAAVKANPKTKKRFDEYGLVPNYGPRHISSGPGFIAKDNIAKVEKYAGQYR